VVADEDAQALHASRLSAAADVDVASQAHDARHAEHLARRTQHALPVELLDEDDAADDQTHRASHADRAERLVREVQKQHTAVQACRHGTPPFKKLRMKDEG
jgi:hypothetical protein